MDNQDKLCKICYEKEKMKDFNYSCKTCKNIICHVCFAKVLLKHEKFNDEYLNDKLIYNCPYCKGVNKLGVYSNNTINNNIIKGLIKLQHNVPGAETELMNRFLDHFMISHNTELSVENNQLKNKIKYLESELKTKKESNLKLLNIATNLKSQVNVLNFKLNESKNNIKEFEIKEFKIKGLLNTAATSTRKTKLFKSLDTLIK